MYSSWGTPRSIPSRSTRYSRSKSGSRRSTTSKGSSGGPERVRTRTGPFGPGRHTSPRRSMRHGSRSGTGGGASTHRTVVRVVVGAPGDTWERPRGGLSCLAVATRGLFPRGAMLVPPGGRGQLTVVRVGNGRPLRKVPSPGNTGSGRSPTGESPSSGAETTQPDGTVKVVHRRFRRDMMKRPPPREQALTDGVRSFPDRRGERGVECCLKRKGAYYCHLAWDVTKGTGRWPESTDSGPRTSAPMDRCPNRRLSDQARVWSSTKDAT